MHVLTKVILRQCTVKRNTIFIQIGEMHKKSQMIIDRLHFFQQYNIDLHASNLSNRKLIFCLNHPAYNTD